VGNITAFADCPNDDRLAAASISGSEYSRQIRHHVVVRFDGAAGGDLDPGVRKRR
jgi:hypothetical protein